MSAPVQRISGQGNCFLRALEGWTRLRADKNGWRVAIGVAGANVINSKRHLHAWLECEGERRCLSAVTLQWFEREAFYASLAIDQNTVRLINPRRIVRRHGIDSEAVRALLDAWGEWYVADGAVLPREH